MVANENIILSCVYIPPYYHDKNDAWLSLFKSIPNSHQPWVRIRDLIDITTFEDKQGGVPFTCTSENIVTSFTNQIRAIDIGSVGTKFTWGNDITIMDRIYQWIDRAIVSPRWISSFPK